MDRSEFLLNKELAERAVGGGVLAGFLCLLCYGVTFGIIRFATAWRWPEIMLAAWGLILAAGPFFVFIRHRHHVQSSKRAALCGGGFALGVLVAPAFFGFYIYNPIALLLALIVAIPFLFVGALTAWLSWALVIRYLPRRVLWQDGTLCPECGYCIIGNTSGVCPECGRVLDGVTVPVESAASPVND